MPSNASDRAKQLARQVGSPVVGYFDEHFQELMLRLQRVTAELGELREESAADSDAATNLAYAVGRFGDEFSQRMEEVASRLETLMIDSGLLSQPAAVVDSAAGSLIGSDVNELGAGLAAFMSWANSFIGWAGDAGLRMNDALYTEWVAGGYELREVNERIVELPFAFSALTDLAPGASVLDVGACESTLALSLASLGYQVTALDVRPYRFEHPNLTTVAEPVEQWSGPSAPFEAVLAISTIEHFGLGAYGEPRSTERLDLVAMQRFRKWLRPGGHLVLTVPFGVAQTDDLQRTYDDAGLDELLDGWDVRQRLVFEQTDAHTWVPATGESPRRGVALVRAALPPDA